MADHHCCGSHSHCEDSSTDDAQPSSSSSSSTEKALSSNAIHKYFSANDEDNTNDESQTLSQLFDLAWSNQNDLQSSSIDTSADDYASKLVHTIRLLESLEKRLASLELFSDNEQIEEISTNNLRYLLLSAFLAWLYQTKRSKPSQRLINVQHACDYYSKFLTMTRNYGIHTHSIPKAPSNEESGTTEVLSSRDVDMMRMAQDRASKIRGHLKRREDEESMRLFEEAMKNDSTDDEAKRKFYLSKIRWWINTAFDDLKYLHGKQRASIPRSSMFA
jgi:immunoglobulin-binding protein 1